jgi:hypothetical protein
MWRDHLLGYYYRGQPFKIYMSIILISSTRGIKKVKEQTKSIFLEISMNDLEPCG